LLLGVGVGDSLSTKLQPLTRTSRNPARTKEKALEGIALIRSPLMAGIGYFVGLYHWQWKDNTTGMNDRPSYASSTRLRKRPASKVDFHRLDGDNDGVACESLPSAPEESGINLFDTNSDTNTEKHQETPTNQVDGNPV